jgi:hypothetical protein
MLFYAGIVDQEITYGFKNISRIEDSTINLLRIVYRIISMVWHPKRVAR